MHNIYLCSFASPSLNLSVTRFQNQAEKLNVYKDIKIFRANDLPLKLINRIKRYKYPIKKMRLFGYALWKPYIIKKYFESIPDGSILQYSDIGCHFNPNGVKRLKEYFKYCDKNNMLVFQYRLPNWNKFKHYKFQEYFEYEYTKSDTFHKMKISKKNKKIFHTPQIWSGCIFFKKNKLSKKLLIEWNYFSNLDKLIDDTNSKRENHVNFKEHRHDQSILSIICKKKNIFSISASECEWAEYANKRVWDHLNNYPILAKRDKKFNFIRRFYDRQKKNLKRKFY